MAKLEILAPFILSFEGGFTNNPLDKGGATNRGVTISTWLKVGYDKDGDGDIDIGDLRSITAHDAINHVMRPYYWNRWQGDKIKSQSVANIVVDWVWGSGKYGITGVQKILGVKQDGIVGIRTLSVLNEYPSIELFNRIKAERRAFIEKIIRRNSSQKIFHAGWIRRLESIGYGALIYNDNTRHPFSDSS